MLFLLSSLSPCVPCEIQSAVLQPSERNIGKKSSVLSNSNESFGLREKHSSDDTAHSGSMLLPLHQIQHMALSNYGI